MTDTKGSRYPYGFILITGPTVAEKVLHCMLRCTIDTVDKNIITWRIN